MKFCKVLSTQAASVLPGGLQTLFPYKAFKKCITTWAEQCDGICSHDGQNNGQNNDAADAQLQRQQQLAACQRELLRMLSAELQRLNNTLMEREELLVMSWQVLEEEAARAMQPQSQQPSVDHQHLQDLLQLLVNFHGDAVMLLNWSHVNFSAVVKALKKFDKRTGSCLRTPLVQRIVCQPFCCTETITQLTHRAEQQIEHMTALMRMQQTQHAMLEAGHPTASAASNAPASPASLTNLNEHLMQEDGAVAPAVPAAASSGGLMPQQGSEGSAGPLNGSQDAMAVQSDDSSSDDMQVEDSAQRHSAPVIGHSLASSGDQQMALCADMSRRFEAALNAWQDLACTASTPSTMLPRFPAPRAAGAYATHAASPTSRAAANAGPFAAKAYSSKSRAAISTMS